MPSGAATREAATVPTATGRLELGPLDIVLLTAAVTMAAVIVVGAGPANDFYAFYEAAKAWRLGVAVPIRSSPNLNPPTLSLVLLPLSYLTPIAARVVWTVLSVVAAIDALRLIGRHLSLDRIVGFRLALALVALQPAAVAWQEGQLTWPLLWLVTRAWLASSRSPSRAGAWLGLAVAVKPPLALMAVLLPIGVCLATAAVSGGVSVFVLALTGWRPWADWLATSRGVTNLAWPLNTSVWGLAARAQGRTVTHFAMADFLTVTSLAVLAVLVALAIVAHRARGARRWLLAGLWSLAASPAGWTYYLPVLLGPELATPLRRRWAIWGALALFAIPMPVVSLLVRSPGLAVLAGSLNTVAAALLWLAWA